MSVAHGAQSQADNDALLRRWADVYRPALLSYLRRRAPAYIDPEDIVQNVFVRLAKRADLQSVRQPERYLFSVASSALTDAIRMNKVRQVDKHFDLDEADLLEDEISLERALASRQAILDMVEAVRELPKRTQTVFFLYHFESVLQADIARMVGVSVSTVENDMRKATAHLLKRVGAYL